ncbi:2-phospho-L-lactate guanylyltransferase [Pigmentiphaga soli]|uniref:2-phospho-L-lactate guanylyltransferase n=1 Tax=Pigmentiphaga soli TaxID=1007095 RepID=A0ABP8GEU0_9BURK
MAPGDFALVPAKGAWAGKSRLAARLSAQARHALNLSQLHATLAAVSAVFGPHGCLVVSPCAEILAAAAQSGVDGLRERGAAGLNGALEQGREALRRRGARMLTIVPVDLPYLDAAELAGVLGGGDAADSVIVPDRALDGTNLLRIPAGLAFPFGYGPGSFGRHVDALLHSGIAPRVHCDTPLSIDLDRPGQLAGLARNRPHASRPAAVPVPDNTVHS